MQRQIRTNAGDGEFRDAPAHAFGVPGFVWWCAQRRHVRPSLRRLVGHRRQIDHAHPVEAAVERGRQHARPVDGMRRLCAFERLERGLILGPRRVHGPR
jgi:hypothetical protein